MFSDILFQYFQKENSLKIGSLSTINLLIYSFDNYYANIKPAVELGLVAYLHSLVRRRLFTLRF